jgi:hypothetical protein
MGETTQPHMITIKNISRGKRATPIVIGSSTVQAFNQEFTIVSDNCSNTTLPSQGICQIAVTFSPVAAGRQVSSLRILNNTHVDPHVVRLVGTGK